MTLSEDPTWEEMTERKPDQHWLCDVGYVNNDEGFVFVRMHDKTDPTSPVEFAEVYLRCFTGDQRDKLGEGVCFHWRVYVADKRNEFEIIEVPPLTPEQEAAIERKAAELAEALGIKT